MAVSVCMIRWTQARKHDAHPDRQMSTRPPRIPNRSRPGRIQNRQVRHEDVIEPPEQHGARTVLRRPRETVFPRNRSDAAVVHIAADDRIRELSGIVEYRAQLLLPGAGPDLEEHAEMRRVYADIVGTDTDRCSGCGALRPLEACDVRQHDALMVNDRPA